MAEQEVPVEFDIQLKLAVYHHFAETGIRPSVDAIAAKVGSPVVDVIEAYRRLAANRMLVLEKDGRSIRMASRSGRPAESGCGRRVSLKRRTSTSSLASRYSTKR